jgi:uncharacterized repeat protein (TIGR01451 family)
MFEELLSILPYNPSLINQLGFYGKRLRAERTVRRIGLIFIVLAFLVQFFAVLSPAQSTVADSTNDLVNGGFSSASEAANICNQNTDGYGTILANYGITCAKVASANTVTLTSTDYSRQLFSMGRLPYPLAGETQITIGQSSNYYVRYLWAWDTGPPSTYQALNVTSVGGQTFFLLYGCGNLTSVGLPVPVAQPPAITVSKTTSPGFPAANSTVTPGEVLSYRIVYGNSGGPAQNVVISDPMPANTTFSSIGGGAQTNSFNPTTHIAEWGWSTLPAGANNDYDEVAVTVNPGVPNGTKICNVATLSATGVPTLTTNQVCMIVSVPTPTPTPVTPVLTIAKTTTTGFPEANSTVTPGTILSYKLAFTNNTATAQNVVINDPLPANTTLSSMTDGNSSTRSYSSSSNNAKWTWDSVPANTTTDYVNVSVKVNANTPNGTKVCNTADISATGVSTISSNQVCMNVYQPPTTTQCAANLSSQDTIACVSIHKTAANLTEGISNANGTTAQPNDDILYTLYAQNQGETPVQGYVFEDQLSDVLDYANVINLYGGTINSDGEVSWPAETIAPGQTTFEQVEIKVMNVIPQTPVSSSDPEHYNLTMTNIYGNTININVPGSTAKTIETTSAALPNTGPGSSLFIGAVIVMLAGYFLTRSRLLAKETAIAIHDNINGGL